MSDQVIDTRAESGGIEYTWPLTITETAGKDISGDAVQLSLGDYEAPGTWRAPDVDPSQTDTATRVVQLLVGANYKPTAGQYWLWSQVGDDPEVVPRRHQRLTILADS